MPLVSAKYVVLYFLCLEETNVVVGPQLTAGPELVEAASQALGTKMEFESIDEYVPSIRPLSSHISDVRLVPLQRGREEDPQLRTRRGSR